VTSASEIPSKFSDIAIIELARMTPEEVDTLPFGVVGLSSEGIVATYNATESRLAGLTAETVIGSPFFLSVAQCMNNFMVAQRFKEETELDVILPYVLTFRMRPTPVKLRLLKTASVPNSYLLIQR
jgi:photoactive yellow protein